MAPITQTTIDQMLAQQTVEFESHFELTPRLIHRVISESDESELLTAGRVLINSEDPDKRILGIRLIQELRSNQDEVSATLLDLLNRELDEEVIYWLVAAFEFVKSDAITDRLISLASSPTAGIRYHVAGALVNRASSNLPEESLQTLFNLCQDVNSEVRFSAVFGLGSLWELGHDERIESRLQQATLDDDPFVARTARAALEGAGGQST